MTESQTMVLSYNSTFVLSHLRDAALSESHSLLSPQFLSRPPSCPQTQKYRYSHWSLLIRGIKDQFSPLLSAISLKCLSVFISRSTVQAQDTVWILDAASRLSLFLCAIPQPPAVNPWPACQVSFPAVTNLTQQSQFLIVLGFFLHTLYSWDDIIT